MRPVRIKIQAPATDQIVCGRPGWRHSLFAPEPREIIEHRGDGGLARPPFVLRGRTKSAPSVLIVSRFPVVRAHDERDGTASASGQRSSSRRARSRHARADALQRPRRSLRVLRVGALTKAQSHLRLDKARIYLARHLPIEHPVPARMHLRGKFSQVRGFMVRVKTKSRDQICRG
jgi:hypothetical protein